jgi:hypothetical protein
MNTDGGDLRARYGVRYRLPCLAACHSLKISVCLAILKFSESNPLGFYGSFIT